MEDLGPLFIHPYEAGYFWIVVLIVSSLTIAACLWVLIRGKLPPALSSAFMVLLPVVAYLLGDMHLMNESKRASYCGSCHESMSPLLETMREDDSTLAGLHYQRGAVSFKTACYTCHSGYGITGDMSAKLAGVQHMIHTALGTDVYPLKLRAPFDVDSCLDCHAAAKSFQAVEVHRDPGIQQALVSREMGCTGACHPSAHPAVALNGAAAWAEAR